MAKVSVIIPARNEESLIGEAILRVRRQARLFPVEVIVVDGQSSDRTRERAAAHADLVLAAPAPGRGRQMHLGAQQACGDLLLFLHADTRLPEDWQAALERCFIRDRRPPAAAAFKLRFDSDRFFYRLCSSLANFRARLTRVPYGDQGLAVTRQAYFQAGGFPDVPLMEEYAFLPRLRRIGRLRLLKESAVTSCRRYERRGPLRNALRNLGFVALYYLGVPPVKLAELYERG